MNHFNLIKQFKFILLLIVLLNQSCSFKAKDNYLKDFTAFVSDVENNYTSYTTEDWALINDEFNEFTGYKFDQQSNTLTDEDKKEIGKLVARFSVVRAKGYGKQLKSEIDDAKKYIEGFLEELSDETKKNINQLIQ
jgi:hypothetical protein